MARYTSSLPMKVLQFLVVPMLVGASLANAQISSDMKMAMPAKSASATAAAPVMTEGVVQSVDVAKGLVTLKHGDIVSIQMPAMTMAYGVADKTMLGQIKAGDKVKFHVEMMNNAPTVTLIEPSR
jgi:Cu(I)/Ag(I) efflux system protein CusF